jgi:hypothetical protein
MTWLESAAVVNAVCASLLGGLAVAYAHFAWTHGNGFRHWMRWLAPLWALVAFYHAAIWTADAFNPDINTLQWMRPVSWLLLAIPAMSLFFSLREDTDHRAQERQAEATLQAATRRLERMRDGNT